MIIKTNYVVDDNKVVSYEILENGYKLYLDGNDWIYQYEPYIPNHNKSYEENAWDQIKELAICEDDIEIPNLDPIDEE